MPTLDRISNYVTTTRVTQKNWDVNTSEAATRVVLYKKVFFEISQQSQKNTCARVSFLLKKRLWRKCFSVNFVKFLRKPFYTEHFWWLLLESTIFLALMQFNSFFRHTGTPGPGTLLGP